MIRVAIMHCDLPRTNWHASELQNFTYRYLPEYGVDHKLIFHGEPLPDERNIDLIDFSEFCNPWHQEVALTYSVPIVCSTEEGSLNSLCNYLFRNRINTQFMLSRIKHFIARTSWTKDMLLNFGINGDKISVIPYGSDLERFKPARKEPEEPAFLYVGSINKQKGVHHLLEAYAKIKDKTDWKLKLCVGEFNNDEKLLEEIKKMAERYDEIELIPFPSISKLPEIYHGASCFVLPQDWGSVLQFGYPLVWAISCGLPAISLDQGAARDYIRSGENGFLCQKTREIAERMLEITRMDWKTMGKVSRNIAEKLFDPKRVAKKHMEVYAEAVCDE